MATPRVVQRQLEEAEALQQAMQAPPVAPSEPTPAPAPAEPAPPAPEPVNWEQRFKTLQGMYQSEVPQLRAQNKAQEAQLVQLTEQVRALTQAVQKAATPQQPEKPSVDQRDVEAFGAELVDMVTKYAKQSYDAIRQELQASVTQLDQRVKELENNVNGVRQETAESKEEQFYVTLQTLVPDWQEVNGDERWLAWLAEVDPVYGVPRQAALDRARATFNAQHAANLFKAFKQTLPTKPSAQQLVTPRTNASPSIPEPQAPARPISRKFINDFYLDVAKGRYAGREAEQQRIDAEINQAVAEGRVV